MNDDIFDSFSVLSHLVLLNGSIALILKYRKIDTFHISILGELGVKESWTKLFIVGPLPCLDYPIGTGKKGDILFRNKDGGLVLFDLNTQMIVDLGISQRIDCKIVIHKENLLPFEGKNM
jgi:molecular chaperone HtpG